MYTEPDISRLRFEREEGKFYWVTPPKHHPEFRGREAGCVVKYQGNRTPRWVINLMGVKWKRSRLVFFAIRGRLPRHTIDHINGNTLDDRPSNLREATNMQNTWNSKDRKRRIALPMGVRHLKDRYQARICHNNKRLHLGTYSTVSEAHAVYLAKREELFGEFAPIRLTTPPKILQQLKEAGK